jgi:hypothetical protein
MTSQAGDTVGLQQTRADVLDRCSTTFESAGGDWPKLAATFQDTTLRVLAPNKAEFAADPFSSTYLDAYILAVWKSYQTVALTVDASEVDPKPDPVLFSGKTVLNETTGAWTWTFSNGSASVVLDGLPTSNQVLGCGQGIMEAQNNSPQAVVVRAIGAGMNVGVLAPVDQTAPLTKAQFQSLYDQFYKTDAPHASTYSAPTGGPWYNVYAGALHSFGDSVYAFAFDDAVGQDSTLYITSQDGGVTCTIGDMTGTVIPTTTDDRSYDVWITVGADCTLTVGDDSYTSAQSPVALTGLSSVFTFSYKIGSAAAQDVTAYLLTEQASLTGATVTKHDGDTDGTKLDIGLPGAPSTNKVNTQTSDHTYVITFAAGGNCSGVYAGTTFSGSTIASSGTAVGPSVSFTYTTPKATQAVSYTMNIEDGTWSPQLPENTQPSVQQTDATDPAKVYIALPGF